MRSVVLSLILAAAIDAAGQSCPGFSPAAVFPTGTVDPHSTVTADFNGDGNLDLATANGGTDDVTILLGNGVGSFGAPVSFPAGDFPWSIATADFNEDGAADLAVVDRNASSFAILLGNGAGSFSAPISFATPSSPFALATGDFNEDGNVDAAVATFSGVSIYAGTGTGSFGAPLNYIAGDIPWSIAVADFNGDVNADLAVANRGTNNVSILFGTGAGTFSLPTNYPVLGQNPQAIAAGDFNGDGDIDLATANTDSENISVLTNAGNGTFGAATNYSTRAPGDANPNETFPDSIIAAELTGDGLLDLAVTNFGRGNVVLFAGTGTGTLTPVFPVPAFSLGAAVHVIAGDFDEDGSNDLAVTGILPGQIYILLNACVAPIPALSPLALLALTVMTGAAGLWVLRLRA